MADILRYRNISQHQRAGKTLSTLIHECISNKKPKSRYDNDDIKEVETGGGADISYFIM